MSVAGVIKLKLESPFHEIDQKYDSYMTFQEFLQLNKRLVRNFFNCVKRSLWQQVCRDLQTLCRHRNF